MKTSIIFPLGNGSRWNDTELRYSLRGIEQHLSNYGEVFVIGERPSFLSNNIIHIPATDGDKTYNKERNIYTKIMAACNDPRVSDDFLFMNDDHFLLSNYRADQFPYYFDGMLGDVSSVSDYRYTLHNTKSVLGVDVPCFDVHTPIVYNKRLFQLLSCYDWSVKFGYCIKTAYCARAGVAGKPYQDLKIKDPLTTDQIKELIKGRDCFSVDNQAREGGLLQVLNELYPTKSRYEA